MSTNRVPFLNLPDLHKPLKEEILALWSSALDTAGFIGGPQVAAFEEEFGAYCEADHCVGVGSGTDALRFALMALGIGPGDTVITVPNTFIATTEAISQVGADIAFVDVDSETVLMDPASLREAAQRLQGKAKAIVPVHLYGQTADMDPINEIAAEFGLKVIEDAAQAQGAKYKGKAAGSLADIAAFSFYPGKNLGACGEAGAVTTNDEELAKKVAMIRDHGQAKKYHHDIEGYNGRLDAIQAGALRVKLRVLEGWNESRRNSAAAFDAAFGGFTKVHPVAVGKDNVPARHIYVVHVDDRDALAAHLNESGIDSALHYPISLHLQKCYEGMELGKGSFPVAEKSATSLLSLPMFPGMTDEQVQRVIAAVTEYEGK